MADTARNDLIEEPQGLPLNVMNTADEVLEAAERRREAEVKAVTLNLQTERLNEQQDFGKRMEILNGGMKGLQAAVANLSKKQRDALSDQISGLASLVR